MFESLFNKVAGLRPFFIKKKTQIENFVKFLITRF